MQLIEIEIRGAIGIKKGLGVDQIKLDLSNKTGLIALAGPNGRGKTTLLELMSPYRTFASRKGKLGDHFFLKDSFVNRTYLHGGNKYRLEIKINSESKRTEGFIYINDSEKSETTGKNKEYDRIITELFGSESLFYNSTFCAQNSGNISNLTTGEVKELFVEFLQIGKLAEYETQCKKSIGFFEQKKEIHDTELAGIITQIEKTTGYESELKILQDEKKQIKENIESCEKTIQELRDKLEKKKEVQTQNKIKIQERRLLLNSKKPLTFEISDISVDIGNNETQKQSEIDSKNDELKIHNKILSEKDSILSASDNMKTNQEKIDRLVKDLDLKNSDFQKQKDIKNDLGSKSEKIRHEIELLENNPELQEIKQSGLDSAALIISITKDINSIENKIHRCENNPDLITEKNRLENLNKTVSLSVNPNCNLDCPAKVTVQEAIKKTPNVKQSIQNLERSISKDLKNLNISISLETQKKEDAKTKTDKLRDDYVIKSKEIKKSISELRESTAKIIQNQKDNNMNIIQTGSDIDVLFQSIASCKHQIEENKKLAEKLPVLKVAESKTEDIKKQIQEKTQEFETKIEELNKKKELKESELKKLNDQVLELEKNIDTDTDDLIDIYKKKISDAESSLEITRKSISTIDKNIAVTENDLKKKAEYIILQEKQERIITAINQEISEWTYLKLSCSKTGLQALEIDGASPLITREANNLLELSFGLDFQIKIVTQDPETGREVFQVFIIRGDGSETEFSLFSGGEQVWIAKALTLGMSIVSRQKSGKDFKSLFADEEDGALDSKKVIKFIQLYRSMTKIGYDTCFYISHNETAVSMADHKIDFSSEKLRIV